MRSSSGIAHRQERARRLLAVTRSGPYFAIAGVLFGALISLLSGRLTVFGLADIRGAVHAGIDEGAWISTAFTVAQMVIVLPSVFLGSVFGPRRVLLAGGAVYTIASLLLPFSENLTQLLVGQTIVGLSSGTFVPLTIGVILREVKWPLIPFGIAAYAMNTELSLNISASLEGWFTDHWSWRWIFWDTTCLAPAMMLCLWLGLERDAVNAHLLRNTSWSGILLGSSGFALLYAALDQGNRLDWFNSGLITGLVLGGLLLVSAFILHEALAEHPTVNFRFLLRGNLPCLVLLVVLFRFVILSTSYIIPQYTTIVHGFRGLDTGHILLWIGVPQLALAPLAATTLLRIDARVPMTLGFALIGLACWMATDLTGDWASGDFLVSQILQAIGQSFAFTALIYFNILNLNLKQVLSFGAAFQTARLFGGELGNGFIQTFIRVREQVHSNLTGLHVQAGSYLTDLRIQELGQTVLPRSGGGSEVSARALALLNHAVQIQADVLSYIDGFMLVAWTAVFALVIMLLLRTPPPSPFGPPAADTAPHLF